MRRTWFRRCVSMEKTVTASIGAAASGGRRESGNSGHRHSGDLRGRNLCAGAVGVARKGRTQERRAGLLPGESRAALVGHRHVADRGEHFRRTDRRHVGLRLRDGHGHRVVRVDGGAHADRRRQVDPAGVPQERHLHDAGVPREAVQPGGAQRDGRLLARAVHLRESHVDPVAGRARGERDHRPRPADRDHRARRCSRCCTRCTAA